MTRHLIDFAELDLEIELAIEYGPVPSTRRVMILGCACVFRSESHVHVHVHATGHGAYVCAVC